jgi:hypothetical protein
MAMNENIKYCPYLFCKYSFGFNQQLVSTPYYRMMLHKYITGFGGKTQVHAGKVCRGGSGGEGGAPGTHPP